MAEIKNTFIQSKMNQDMDARIIPNGQYRSALNVSISRSESADVGALETVLGTLEITDFGLTDCNLKAIGHFMDVSNNRIFVFITNYNDSSPTRLTNKTGAFSNVESYIAYFDTNANIGNLIVGGGWLNFSKTHPIHGINLLEDLLFWTDNRNQPRKINVSYAISNPYTSSSSLGYYFNEDQISVAKYYPFEPIYLLEPSDPTDVRSRFESSMKDVVNEWLPPHALLEVTIAGTNFIEVAGLHNIGVGKTLYPTSIGATSMMDRITGPNVSPNASIAPDEVLVWNAVNGGSNTTLSLLNQNPATPIAIGDVLYLQRRNPYYNASWPGDPDYLKDKFARFSYRFKFDDGEYSLIAPFTQIAFVPEQDGYFMADNVNPNDVDNSGPDQETETYRSSVVSFMENKINDITLNIQAPTDLEVDGSLMNWEDVNNKLKIIEVDILWKSADDQSIKVIETLPIDYFKNNGTSSLEYTYQSTKPWKTLPSAEITRVYDKVPVRALGQESAGNRIIYGNFLDKHTSPPPLDYTVIIDEKQNLPTDPSSPDQFDLNAYTRKEYQNHTLKQNRTYQVGVVLSDRYGRQSDVILSQVTNGDFGKASTIYHPYRDKNAYLVTDRNDPQDPNDTWPGDQLITLFNNTIPKTISTADGYPGLFSINDGSIASIKNITGFDWTQWMVAPANCIGCQYLVPLSLFIPGGGGSIGFCLIEDLLNPGQYVIDTNSISFNDTEGHFTNGQIVTVCFNNMIDFPLCSIGAPGGGCFSFEVVCPENNPLGWYSYKIVVKQTEQEYYNVYLPGMLAGYPKDIRGSALIVDPATGVVSSPVTLGEKYPSGLTKKECHIVLINDNVNKVPRDLKEVGPDQQQFRSSVVLYGRVENKKDTMDGGNWGNINQQYQPGILGDTVTTIGPMTELNLGRFSEAGLSNLQYNFFLAGPQDNLIPPQWYNGDSNPLIARVSTKNLIGQPMIDNGNNNWTDETMTPYLSVYETKPIESLLDIYWETTTSGLISELNKSIIDGENGVIAETISNASIIIPEEGYANGFIPISANFWAEGPNGLDLDDAMFNCTIDLIDVTYADGSISLDHKFQLNNAGIPGKNRYYLTKAYGEYQLAYEDPNKTNLNFIFEITQVLPNPSGGTGLPITTTVSVTGIVTNEVPQEFMYPDRDKIKDWTYPNFLFPSANNIGYVSGDGDPPYGGIQGAPCKELYAPNNEACLYTPTTGNNYLNSIQYYTPTEANSFDVISVDPFIRKTGKGRVKTAPGYAYSTSYYWDGVFKANNGIYGSAKPTPPGPISSQMCWEIEYKVVRTYQVSAILGYNRTSYDKDEGRNNGLNSCVSDPANPCTNTTHVPPPAMEYVFGQNYLCIDAGGIGLPNTLKGDSNNQTNGYESNEYRHAMYSRPLISPTSLPVGSTAMYADQLLNGPQYIDWQPNWGISNPTDNSASGNGEKYVGEKYNGEKHYWMDLDAKMRFYTRRRASGDPSNPANFWPNPSAAATGTYNIWDNGGCFPGIGTAPFFGGTGRQQLLFSYDNSTFTPTGGPIGAGKFTTAYPHTQNAALDVSDVNGFSVDEYQMQEINACTPWGTTGPWTLYGLKPDCYLGPTVCVDSDGLVTDGLYLAQLPGPFTNDSASTRSNWSKTTHQNLVPHFKASNSSVCPGYGFTPQQGILEVVPGIVGGTKITMPPGRYVVTVAAIDKNGSGLSFEWDVPIVIYETAIHEGRFLPGAGDGGSTDLYATTGIIDAGVYSAINRCGCVTTKGSGGCTYGS